MFLVRGQNLIREDGASLNRGSFEKLRTEAVEYSGWSEKDKISLVLEPGVKGIAIYRYQKPLGTKVVTLESYFGRPNPGTNEMSVSSDNKNWQPIIQNSFMNEKPVEITDKILQSESFFVKIEANNQSPRDYSVLQSLNLNYFKEPVYIPNILIAIVTFFLPIVFILRPSFSKLLLIAVLLIGLYLSFSALNTYGYRSLDPDAICLKNAVFNVRDLKTGFFGVFCVKESAIVMIYLTFFKIFGHGSELAIRFSSVFFHLATIVLVFLYGKKIGSNIGATISSLLVASHPYLVSLSIRGVRDTAFTFAVLLFTYLFFETNLTFFKRKLQLIFSVFLLIYLRLHSLIQFIPVVIIFTLSKRVFWKEGIFALLTLILLSFPIILTNLKYYKTWNYSEQMHTRWNTNVEFQGKPGFPTVEEVTKQSFRGEPVSTYTYFFKLHTIEDLIISSFRGMIKTFRELYFLSYGYGIFLLFTFGSLLMIKSRALRYMPFLIFFLEIPHFFFVEKVLVEFRSLTHSIPFIALTIGYAVDIIGKILRKHL